MGALEYEGALRASLQSEYGFRLLKGGRTDPWRSPSEVADCVVNLPPGCALWRATGGPLSLTTDALLVREHIYRMELIAWGQGGKKGQAPERLELPKPAHEVRAEEQANARRLKALRDITSRQRPS